MNLGKIDFLIRFLRSMSTKKVPMKPKLFISPSRNSHPMYEVIGDSVDH